MNALSALGGGAPSDEEREKKAARCTQYLKELELQIAEKAERKKKEAEEARKLDEKQTAAAAAYQPFGRGGGGAPFRDASGQIITNRKHLLDLQQQQQHQQQHHHQQQQHPNEPQLPAVVSPLDATVLSPSSAVGGVGFDFGGNPYAMHYSSSASASAAANTSSSSFSPPHATAATAAASSTTMPTTTTTTENKHTRFRFEDASSEQQADIVRKQQQRADVQSALAAQVAEKQRLREEERLREEAEERKLEERIQRQNAELARDQAMELGGGGGGGGGREDSGSANAHHMTEGKSHNSNTLGSSAMDFAITARNKKGPPLGGMGVVAVIPRELRRKPSVDLTATQTAAVMGSMGGDHHRGSETGLDSAVGDREAGSAGQRASDHPTATAAPVGVRRTRRHRERPREAESMERNDRHHSGRDRDDRDNDNRPRDRDNGVDRPRDRGGREEDFRNDRSDREDLDSRGGYLRDPHRDVVDRRDRKSVV